MKSINYWEGLKRFIKEKFNFIISTLFQEKKIVKIFKMFSAHGWGGGLSKPFHKEKTQFHNVCIKHDILSLFQEKNLAKMF